MKTAVLAVLGILMLASGATGSAQAQQKYALIVGIKGYPYYKTNDTLRYADEDAQLFYDFITSPEGGGFSRENIRMRKNGEATRNAILEDIQWLGRRVTRNDLVYVFFSGHGSPDEQGMIYFMPYGGDPKLPQDQGFPTNDFVRMLRTKIDAKALVTFIDACHAASAYITSLSKDGSNITARWNDAWHELDRTQPEATSIAFLSASANEESYEDPSLGGGHGIFSWYLVQGLRGSADNNPRDGVVTAGELFIYLLNSVENRAQLIYNTHQSPAHSPEFVPTFPLGMIQTEVANATSIRNAALSRDERARTAARACFLATLGTDYYGTMRRCREAIQIDPGNADSHGNLGFALWYLEDFEGARDAWRTMTELSPTAPYGHANLGRALARLGNTTEGLSEAREATRLDPNGLGPMAESYILHEFVHDFEGAFRITSDWVRRHPTDTSARMDLAEQYVTTGRFAGALVMIDSLLQQPGVEQRSKVALNTLAMVALVGQNQMPDVVARMNMLRAVLEGQLGKFDVGWTFAGTRAYISTSTDANIARWRDWLLRVTTAIENGDRAAAVRELTPGR